MDLRIEQLPNEVLRIILSYVTHPLDHKRVTLVSRRFRDVMRTISRHNFKLNLESNPHAEFRECSEFPFTSIDFGLYQVERFQQCLDNWKLFGNSIAEISVKFVASDFPQLLEHLSTHMPNLKVLKLIQSFLNLSRRKKLKMKHGFFLPEKQFLFPRVDTLDLSQGQCTSDMANYLVLCCPNLKRLMLSDEMRDFSEEKFCEFLHKWTSEGIKIVFYLQMTNFTPLLNAPTENFRIEFLKIHPSMEKLQEFFTPPREIGTLTVISPSGIPRLIFETLFRNQGTIDRLDITSGLPVDYNILPLIAESRAVKTVDLSLDRTIQYLTLPAALEAKIRNFVLSMQFLETDIARLFDRLRFVEKLQFRERFQLSNGILRTIFRNFTNLKELIYICFMDSGLKTFTNYGFKEISKLIKFEKLVIFDKKFSLTEAVFEDFQLPKLKELKISVKEISIQGLKILARNCPNIEILEIYSRFKGDKKEDLETFILENFRYIRKKGIE